MIQSKNKKIEMNDWAKIEKRIQDGMESGNSVKKRKKKIKKCDGAGETNRTIKKENIVVRKQPTKTREDYYRDWSKIGMEENDRNGQKVSGIEENGKGKEIGEGI